MGRGLGSSEAFAKVNSARFYRLVLPEEWSYSKGGK